MAKAKFERTKPHVNVGTIGHVDHGKTTTTAALTKVSADKGWGTKYIPYDEVAKASESQGRRDATKILTIATSHVEYETESAALRARRLPGPRRLREEHDHGRGADGRRDPGGVGRGRPDAADPRAHPAGPPGERAGGRGLPEQVRPGGRRGAARPGRARGPRAAERSTSSRATTPPVIRGSAIKAIEGDPKWVAKIEELFDALDTYIPEPVREVGQAVPDAGRGRVLDHGPRHGGDGPDRARQGEGGRGGRSWSASAATKKSVVTGVEMFRKLLDDGQAGDNVGLLLRGVEKKDIERGMVLAKPGTITPHTQVRGRGVRADEGRGRPPHAVLQGLPAAVLLPHDGRDGLGASCRRASRW